MEHGQMDVKNGRFEVTHKDFTLYYSDDKGEWRCVELPDITAPQLSLLRQKLDGVTTEQRRLNLDAYYIESRSWLRSDRDRKLEPVKVTIRTTDGYVWVAFPDKRRSKERLASLAPVSEDAEKAFAAWNEARVLADAAGKRADELFERIPRLTLPPVTTQ